MICGVPTGPMRGTPRGRSENEAWTILRQHDRTLHTRREWFLKGTVPGTHCVPNLTY